MKIQPVFHVSLLKPCKENLSTNLVQLSSHLRHYNLSFPFMLLIYNWHLHVKKRPKDDTNANEGWIGTVALHIWHLHVRKNKSNCPCYTNTAKKKCYNIAKNIWFHVSGTPGKHQWMQSAFRGLALSSSVKILPPVSL